MLYLKTLPAITPHELQAVGYRGQDLAFLASQQIPISTSFVILSNLYDEVVRQNNLKYKFDYIMSHAQEHIHSTLINVYSGVRKAMLEAKFPNGFETELKELYDSVTSPVAIGELTTERLPVRVVLSTNRLDDPENNDMIIQNVNTYEELLLAVREAFALVHHPSQLGPRMREKFAESKLKVAVIVQQMEEPVTSCHAYSSLPQDHTKTYLQTYYGYLDLREKVIKDYYAISKNTLRIVASQVRDQPQLLERDEKHELVLTQLSKGKTDKLNDRELIEIARLTKKVERVLQSPVKVFFTSKDDTHEVLWTNRLGFDIIIAGEPEKAPEAPVREEPIVPQHVAAATPPVNPAVEHDEVAAMKDEVVQVAEQLIEKEDFIMPEDKPTQAVPAKLLSASLKLLHQVVERKYQSTFTEQAAGLAEMLQKLNAASTFSRPVDAALLTRAEEAARSGTPISEEEYTRAVEEISFLLGYV